MAYKSFQTLEYETFTRTKSFAITVIRPNPKTDLMPSLTTVACFHAAFLWGIVRLHDDVLVSS